MTCLIKRAGWTPLHYAALNRLIEFAQFLIEAGANLKAKDTYMILLIKSLGCSPLHFATYFGSIEIAQMLINAGADVNAKDR